MGEPIPIMVNRVKEWLRRGRDVRIFTARVSYADKEKCARARKAIEGWCLKHLGKVLPVTNVKDFDTLEIWDDKAFRVIRNVGLTDREVNRRQRHSRVSHTGELFNGH